jgi:hypothetical protein
LYAHFGSREGILAAVAIEGFQEMGLALEKARKLVKRGNTVESASTFAPHRSGNVRSSNHVHVFTV